MREFDVIIYGAAGLTASHVVKEISRYNLKVALSARNTDKITYNPKNYPLIQCSTETIDNITRRTDILLNCAGPYIKCGHPIVESCIRQKCHYIDITGETTFIRQIREKYHKEAEEKGIYIVNCAGFDSIPSDISFDIFKNRILQECPEENRNSIEIWNYLKARNFRINYGTWESLILGIENYFKGPKLDRKRKERKLPAKSFYSNERQAHCAIFMGTDHSVVTRSQEAFHEKLGEPKVPFYIYVELGNILNKLLFMMFFSMIMIFARFKFGRYLLLKYYSFFTYGYVRKSISEDQISKSSFQMSLYGFYRDSSNNQKKMEMRVSGPDPGYKTTPICIVTAALVLKKLQERGFGDVSFEGGVVTPAMMFRETDIVDKLRSRGVLIQ